MHTIPIFPLKYPHHWYNHMRILTVILSNVNPIYETLTINPEYLVAPQRITITHTYVGRGHQQSPLLTWLSVGHHPLILDMIQDLIYYQLIYRFIPIWILRHLPRHDLIKYFHQLRLNISLVHMYYNTPMWLQWVYTLMSRGRCRVKIWNRCPQLTDIIKMWVFSYVSSLAQRLLHNLDSHTHVYLVPDRPSIDFWKLYFPTPPSLALLTIYFCTLGYLSRWMCPDYKICRDYICATCRAFDCLLRSTSSEFSHIHLQIRKFHTGRVL